MLLKMELERVWCCLLVSLLTVPLPVGTIQLYHTKDVGPTSPCGQRARSQDLHACLKAIRTRAEDPSLFWFGNSYTTRCPRHRRLQADCYNPRGGQLEDPRQGSESLVSRILSLQELDPALLDRYLEVTYTTRPGTYKGCEKQWTYNKSREVTVDPLSMAVMAPYEVRAPPAVTWQVDEEEEKGMEKGVEKGDNSTLYTLLFYDVGYLTVKSLHVNIPGNDLAGGQTVVDYEGPLNPTRNDNPYVFLLFRQPGVITLDHHWTQVLQQRAWEQESLYDFMKAYNLHGPVALSWVLVHGDAYAAEIGRVRGNMNTCAHFVTRAFQAQDIEFVPNKTYYGHTLKQLSVYVNVTFEAPAIAVNSCCTLHSYPACTFNLNPLGDARVLPVHTRSDATVYVTLHMATAFPDTQRDFEYETLTLLMADGDVPTQAFGNRHLPFVHWFVVNIRGGDVASGDVVQSYMGPAPPDPHPHTYYYLLFRQSRDLDLARVDYSAVNCSWAFRGRCRFNVNTLVSEQGLQLIGVTWMVASHDEFVRELYVQGGMSPPCVACHGVPGYAEPCPTPDLASSSASTFRAPAGMTLGSTGMVVVVLPWWCPIGVVGVLLRLLLEGLVMEGL